MAILEAAVQVLRAGGLERFTVARVARRAGVAVGSIYQYFPRKDALIAEVRRRQADAFDRTIREHVEQGPRAPFREAVRASVEAMLALHREQLEEHRALDDGGRPLSPSELRELRGRMHAYLQTNRDEFRPLDVPLATFVATRALEALVHEAPLDEPEWLAHPQYAAEVTELFCRYLER